MGVGEVEITLGDKTVTLRSSLGAAKRVSAAGGYTNVMEKLMAYDMSYFVTVVSAGLNKKPMEVEEDVYKTGLPNLVADLVTYVGYLANGGRPADMSSGEKETGEA
ncbi:hypothetical protein [Bradyrhizobium elkanii]|jgi:hypothetical protein|uniref:hypothetical protein n=1 Tax=Bradyrhizobium elkanii TaxID=29448 RepID=UPI0022266223|nr:hypothetical protein [Bradyrhizobium elkanii]MCW2228091.1 hypothetical protein [Bradyrhizobium elkanii]